MFVVQHQFNLWTFFLQVSCYLAEIREFWQSRTHWSWSGNGSLPSWQIITPSTPESCNHTPRHNWSLHAHPHPPQAPIRWPIKLMPLPHHANLISNKGVVSLYCKRWGHGSPILRTECLSHPCSRQRLYNTPIKLQDQLIQNEHNKSSIQAIFKLIYFWKYCAPDIH